MTGRWDELRSTLEGLSVGTAGHFDVVIGCALLALHDGNEDKFRANLDALRREAVRNLSSTSILSLQASHDIRLRFHALSEIEAISGMQDMKATNHKKLITVLNHKLEVLGAYSSEKQYVLGLRRAVIALSKR